jgi:hypothetical protein
MLSLMQIWIKPPFAEEECLVGLFLLQYLSQELMLFITIPIISMKKQVLNNTLLQLQVKKNYLFFLKKSQLKKKKIF